VALVQLFLAEQGYRTVCCFQGNAALDLIQHQHPDLVLLDMQMEQRDTGLRVLEKPFALEHVPRLIPAALGASRPHSSAAPPATTMLEL
jgi:CheY-like chemotaxis protein